MFNHAETQRTLSNTAVDDYLLTWVEAFLIDRKARGLSKGTLYFYNVKLKLFTGYCETQVCQLLNAGVLYDGVHVDAGVGQGVEKGGGYAGPIGYTAYRYSGNVGLMGYSRDLFPGLH